MLRIGVDLGGTKIEAAALDGTGAVVARRRVPTPVGYEATVEAAATLVRELLAEWPGPASVGFGTPGSASPSTGLMRNANSTALNGRPLRADLERAIGREIRLANDANCFTLSEAVDGAGAGAGIVFGVILGTGVGGGIAVEGRVLLGANAIAGEWGHNPLPAPERSELPGPGCYCGRTGCIESWLSGPGLSEDHRRATGDRLGPLEIAGRADGGDEACEATLARYERRLARALAGIVNVLDPQVIVLGGGLSNLGRLYRTVPRLWGAHVFSDAVRTRLVPPLHGDSSGVRGAAWLWEREA